VPNINRTYSKKKTQLTLDYFFTGSTMIRNLPPTASSFQSRESPTLNSNWSTIENGTVVRKDLEVVLDLNKVVFKASPTPITDLEVYKVVYREVDNFIYKDNPIDNYIDNCGGRTAYKITDADINQISKYLKRRIYPHVELEFRHNCIYKKDDLLDLLLHMADTKTCAENGSKTFRFFNNGRINNRRIPSADTLLYHIKKLDRSEVEAIFKELFELTLMVAKVTRPDLFRGAVDVAIDITDWLYYGSSDSDMVLGTKPQLGTHHAYKFATICVVKNGFRFNLLAIPMDNCADMDKIVHTLVAYAKDKVRIRRIYLDRGFYNVKIVELLKALDVHFVIRARTQGAKIRRWIRIHQDDPIIIKPYTMKSKKKTTRSTYVNLIIVDKAINKNEKIAFITNIDVNNQGGLVLAEDFKKRWGIETSYRVEKVFRPKTTSKNYIVRLFYFLFSVAVYNIWVLTNLILCHMLHPKADILITAKIFMIALYSSYPGNNMSELG
jgi:hypothetical protein